jgi:hypothetical protein
VNYLVWVGRVLATAVASCPNVDQMCTFATVATALGFDLDLADVPSLQVPGSPGSSLIRALTDLQGLGLLAFGVYNGVRVNQAGRDASDLGLEALWPSVQAIYLNADAEALLGSLVSHAERQEESHADLAAVDGFAIARSMSWPTEGYEDQRRVHAIHADLLGKDLVTHGITDEALQLPLTPTYAGVVRASVRRPSGQQDSQLAVLRPDESTLLRDMLDYRERSHLANRYDDSFAVAFTGHDGEMSHPGLGSSRNVSMRTLRRFEKLGLLDVISRGESALEFDLVDDIHTRISGLETGPPSAPRPPDSRSGSAPSQPPDSPAGAIARNVFISISERYKQQLGAPLRKALADLGIHGIIVSDEPLAGAAFTPEEKVDHYLDESSAVIVIATADLQEAGGGQYVRSNIADEIARARGRGHLKARICVLKEAGVTLPSNVNPAYEHLDVDDPRPAFERALAQLSAWKV